MISKTLTILSLVGTSLVKFLILTIGFFAMFIVVVRSSRRKPTSRSSRRKPDSPPCDWTCPKCKCGIDKRMEGEHPLGNCQICGYDLRAGRTSLRVRLWTRLAPELGLFLPHERQRALRWLPGDPLPIDRQFALSIAAITMMPLFAVSYLAPFLFSALPLPPWVVYIIVLVISVGVGCWLVGQTRGRVRRILRQQLIEAGFAICGPCGYNLRGLTESRCPECGATFDKKLLTDSTPKTEHSGQHANSEY